MGSQTSSPWQRCQCSQKPWPTRSRNMVRLLNPLAHVIDHGSYGSCGGFAVRAVCSFEDAPLRLVRVHSEAFTRAPSSRSDEASIFAECGSTKTLDSSLR